MKRKNSEPSYHSMYPGLIEAGVLTDDVIDEQREYYATHKDDFANQLAQSTKIIHRNGSQIRGLIVPGEANESIVVGGEYGNGITPQVFIRAMGLRAVMAAEATLVVLPNDSLGENNLGFTKKDRRALKDGDATPYTERYKALLDAANATDKPAHIVGMSLGASTGAALAADRSFNARSLTLVEPPHLTGSVAGIAANFASSGAQLNQNFEISRQGIENFDALSSPTALELTKFGIGSVKPSNITALRYMQNSNVIRDLHSAIESHSDMGVVNAYGTEANISPVDINQRIADFYADNPLFKSYELKGADHSVTNAHAVVTALAKRARALHHNTTQ